MSSPLIGVLALQGDVPEHLTAFAACGVPAMRVRTAQELEGVDALALPGGESTTMGRLLRVFDLDAPLRRRLATGMPVFATCAGLILLARHVLDGRQDQLTLGALDVDVRRNAYGRQIYSFEADIDVPRVAGGRVRAVFIRAPAIERVGPGVEVLAECEGRVVGVAQNGHIALSFHPEMAGEWRLHQLFVDRLRAT